VGVVGDHWWYWKVETGEWVLYGHSKPHFAKDLYHDGSIGEKRQYKIGPHCNGCKHQTCGGCEIL